MKILRSSIQGKREKFEIISKSYQLILPFCSGEQGINYHKVASLDMERAPDNPRSLNNKDVQCYLLAELEIDMSLLTSLFNLHLISEVEKGEILNQQDRQGKVKKCLELVCNQLDLKIMSLFIEALRENNLKNIADTLQDEGALYASVVKLGNTVPDVAAMTIDGEAAHQMNPHDIDALLDIATAEHSALTIYHAQHGCIEIFFHSTTGHIYDTIAKELFCKQITEQLFKQKNVQASLSEGQTVTIVVKRNPFSLPLIDEAGHTIKEFSKQQALRLNYTFIKRSIKNLDKVVSSLREYLRSTTLDEQIEILESEKSCNDLDELLQLVQTSENGAWSTFMKLLRDSDNVNIANMIEKMSCIECYRRSVLNDLQKVMDEIDTSMMEKTFEGKSFIPNVVKEDCILSKGKRPRIERVKCFLDYVLIKGDILIRFAEVFASSTNTIITFSPCKIHDDQIKEDDKCSGPEDEIKFIMKVCIDENGKFYLENNDNDDKHVDERLDVNSDIKNDNITNTVWGDTADKLDLSQNKKPILHKEHEDLDVQKDPLCLQIKVIS